MCFRTFIFSRQFAEPTLCFKFAQRRWEIDFRISKFIRNGLKHLAKMLDSDGFEHFGLIFNRDRKIAHPTTCLTAALRQRNLSKDKRARFSSNIPAPYFKSRSSQTGGGIII